MRREGLESRRLCDAARCERGRVGIGSIVGVVDAGSLALWHQPSQRITRGAIPALVAWDFRESG
jgi:hypothetical protein